MIYLGNRRGQIAILMLFVVAVVLVISALFVFFSADSSSPSDFGYSDTLLFGYGNLDSVTEMVKMIAKESIISNVPFVELKQKFLNISRLKHDALTKDQITFYGNFFFRVENKDAFNFVEIVIEDLNKQKIHLYKFNVTGLFIKASSGTSEEMKNIDLCMLFDKEGNYLKELANEEIYKPYCR